MIISHSHKFIFVKTRKTAGSAIEKYLAKYLDPNQDICTGSEFDGTPRLGKYKSGHKDCNWIKQKFPNEWNEYYKFAVTRNPWDMMVSFYYWHKKIIQAKVAEGSFEDFILNADLSAKNDWKRMYTENNQMLVDYVCKYESLNTELFDIPIPYAGELQYTFAKTGVREVKDYKSMYTEETKELVANEFKEVIERFNYSFE